MTTIPFRHLMKEKRAALKLSQKDLSQLSNITPTLISKYEKGQSKPRIETAKRIAKVLNINLETLVKSLDQDEVTLIKIPVYVEDSYDDEDFFHIPSNFFQHINYDDLIAYKFRGDSMSPRFNDGDVMIINKADKDIGSGRKNAFLIEYEDTYSGIKYVAYNEFAKEYIIYSENELYAPIYFHENKVNIIGRVFWYCRMV